MNSYLFRNIFVIILSLLVITSCEEKVEQIKPEFRPMTESVYASVTVQPKDLYNVYPSVNGVIQNLFIDESQIVKKGERLVQIKNSAPKVNIEKAQLNAQLAQQNFDRQADLLQAIEDDMAGANMKYMRDSIDYARQKKLWKQDIGSQIELDNRKLAFDLSKNQLAALRNKYQSTKAERMNQLETQIQIAKNNLKASQVSNNDFVVKSQIEGKVYAVFKNTGETVFVQEPIAMIGAANDFLIEMEVDEVDIARLKNGQQVLITLDAYGKEVFEATIFKIYPQKQVRTQTFKVESIFKNPPTTLYPGLSGEANVVISQKPEIMTIPLSYLIDDRKVKTDTGEIEVKTGLRDMRFVEILSGIDTSTYLIKPE